MNRELLWKILARCGVPEKIIIVLKKLYNNTTISLTMENIESIFKSTCGVKQGDNLAPILFVIFLNAVITTLEKKWKFKKPDFQWFPNTKKENKSRGKLSAISLKNKGEKFDFFNIFMSTMLHLFYSQEKTQQTAPSYFAHTSKGLD